MVFESSAPMLDALPTVKLAPKPDFSVSGTIHCGVGNGRVKVFG
jgi:hypothetical protein